MSVSVFPRYDTNCIQFKTMNSPNYCLIYIDQKIAIWGGLKLYIHQKCTLKISRTGQPTGYISCIGILFTGYQ